MFEYGEDNVDWLWHVLEAKPHWTPLDVLETENRYPGLIDELFTFGWQRLVINKEVEDSRKS